MIRLDQEERELLEAFDAGELKQAPDAPSVQKRHQEYAEAMFGKEAQINIQISHKALQNIQIKAQTEGVSCQTLIAGIIHKYVEGHLHEVR